MTWHQGTVSKTLAQFTGDIANRPNIFVDPNKNIWITGRGIHIYRITPDGKAECAYTIEYDHRYDANLPQGARLNFDPVYATADGQGRIWFWSGGLGGGGGVPSLEGILICDGKNFDHHPRYSRASRQALFRGRARRRGAHVAGGAGGSPVQD